MTHHHPKISLVEVFAAPQGEGYHAGRWSVFVRLAGCPLACEFAPGVVCDTPYQQANLKLSLDALFELIASFYSPRPGSRLQHQPMLVLTGGEPTTCPQFDAIVGRAVHLGHYVAVETNGTKWRDALDGVHWITVSPKEDVPQTSRAPMHNHNPQSPLVSELVREELAARAISSWPLRYGAEYRYVISADSFGPQWWNAPQHYVSPAVVSDGSGEEWKHGFPGFAPGAVDRCLSIIKEDPRWHISIQSHKVLGVR